MLIMSISQNCVRNFFPFCYYKVRLVLIVAVIIVVIYLCPH